jgi:hypothetical protein
MPLAVVRYQQAEKKRTRPQYLTSDLSKTELTKQ